MGAMDAFARQLKELREMSGLNQAQLAEKLGVSRGSISFYENGDRIPDIEFLYRMSRYFSVSADWLLGLTNLSTPDMEVRKFCDSTGLSEYTVSCLVDMKEQAKKEDDREALSELALLDQIIKLLCKDSRLGIMIQYATATFENSNMPVSFNYKDDDGHPYNLDMTIDGFIQILRQIALNSMGEVLDKIRASGQCNWKAWKEEHISSKGQSEDETQE